MADENTNTETDSERNLTKLLGKKDGDAMALAADLLTENAQLRADKRALNLQLTEVQNKVPADDSLTLSKADSERWRSLSGKSAELGGVDKLLERLGRVDTLEKERAQTVRADTIRSAGYDPKKLGRLIGDIPFKVTGEGDDRQALITVDDKDVPLGEWAEAEGIADVVNVMRLDSTARPVVMPQAGKRTQQTQDTWAEAANSRFGVTKRE